MSDTIETKIVCPICHGTDFTFDFRRQEYVCNRCGLVILNIKDLSSYVATSSTATTVPPYAIIEEEESRELKRKRLVTLPHTHEEMIKLEKTVSELENKVAELTLVTPKVVVIEEVPKEEAKRRVEEYMKEHKTADIEELMVNLKIELRTLVDIIDELRNEGKIVEKEEN